MTEELTPGVPATDSAELTRAREAAFSEIGESQSEGEESPEFAEVPEKNTESTPEGGEAAGPHKDYAAIAEDDLRILKAEFEELSDISDITALPSPLRYAALRDLGLSPTEAYLATSAHRKRDNRSHLVATRTVSVSKSGAMSEAELSAAREIFSGISDSEIRRLYKKVTK